MTDLVPTLTRRAPARTTRAALFASPTSIAAVIIIVAVVVVSIAAPALAPDDPNIGHATSALLGVGSDGHLLGTDTQGRDLLSRLLYGGRITLGVVVAAVAVAVALGTVVGLAGAFAGRRTAAVFQRLLDLLFAFPVILVSLSLAAVLTPNAWVVGASIVFAATPYVARIVLGEATIERDKEYVAAARASGAGTVGVAAREVLPNIVPAIIVYGTSLIGVNIVFAASLSALGLGVQPPTADWGRMIAEGAPVLLTGNPGLATFPALIIAVIALAFNWLGEGIRNVVVR